MRIFISLIIILVNIILQSTVLQYIRIIGIMPNIPVILIVSYGLLRGSMEGAIYGLVSGLFLDILFGDVIGFYALIYMWTGYLAGIPSENFYRENYVLPFALTTLFTFVNGFYVYTLRFFFRGHLDFFYFLRNPILPEVVYTAALSFLVYRILYGINNRIENVERRKAKMF